MEERSMNASRAVIVLARYRARLIARAKFRAEGRVPTYRQMEDRVEAIAGQEEVIVEARLLVAKLKIGEPRKRA
jgi:hypothetical protein